MTITGQSSLDKDEIDQMVKDAEAHADEDRRRREEAEIRNQADTLVYQTEKLLREQGEKISGDEKTAVEAALADLKGVKDGTDVEAIKPRTEELMTASQTFTQKLYEAASAEAHEPAPAVPAPAAPAGRPTTTWSTPRSSTTRTEVTDDVTPVHRRRRRPTSSRRRPPDRGGAGRGPGRPRASRAAVDVDAEPARPRPRACRGDLEPLLARARPVPRRLRRAQADFENYRKRTMKQQADADRRAVGAAGREQLLPVLDACRRRHVATEPPRSSRSSPRCSAPSRRTASSALDPDGRAVRPHRARGRRARTRRGRRGTVGRRGPARRLPLEGRVLRPAMVKVRGPRADRPTGSEVSPWRRSGVVREGLLQGPRRAPRRASQKEITQRVPEAGAPVPPRRQPRRRRRRGALQGGLRRLRRASATRTSARSTTRSAGSARWAACSAAAGGRRRAAVPARASSASRTSAISATSWAACSAAGGGRGTAARPWHRPAARATTSRPSCTSPSRTRCRAHHDDPPHLRRRLLDLPRQRGAARHDRRRRARSARAAA